MFQAEDEGRELAVSPLSAADRNIERFQMAEEGLGQAALGPLGR